MKVKLLRKIKKNYSIVKRKELLNSSTIEVFRLLHKGKKVDYAWVESTNPQNYRLLVLGVAYKVDWETVYYCGRPGLKYAGVEEVIDSIRRERKKAVKQKRYDSEAIKVWP